MYYRHRVAIQLINETCVNVNEILNPVADQEKYLCWVRAALLTFYDN